MVVVQLNGGLGNQMFQYALGRAISTQLADEFYLDTSSYRKYKLRTYDLSHFCIKEKIAPLYFTQKYQLLGWKKKWNTIKETMGIMPKAPLLDLVQERQYNFDPAIFECRGNLYLCGYWQSEKYFKNAEAVIRQDFSLRCPMSEESQKIEENMQNCESVAIHVRRGDYVSNSVTNSIHGTMTMEYYRAAIECITDQKKIDQFYVFSDDFDWVREHFSYLGNVSFLCRDTYPCEELILMSKCKHNIIANSSFSWWGAWLNSNPEKIVVAPRQWFQVDDYDTKDLIPDGWVKL